MSWEIEAACRGMDTEIFFPKPGSNPGRAKEVCASCVVQGECLQRALDAEEYPWQRHGVYGGLSALDRARQFDGKPVSGKTRTECRQGHALSGDNVLILPSGRRRCRICSETERPECRRGHTYTEENIYYSSTGVRCCVRCRRDASKAARDRRKAKAA